MSWFRKKKILTPDEATEELYCQILEVKSWLWDAACTEWKLNEMIHNKPTGRKKGRMYENTLMSLWVIHICVPFKELLKKVVNTYLSTPTLGRWQIDMSQKPWDGYHPHPPSNVFQKDLRDRYAAYAFAAIKLKYEPNTDVEEFGGMAAQALLYGLPPTNPPTNVKPKDARRWHDIVLQIVVRYWLKIDNLRLDRTIEGYSDSDLSYTFPM